MNNKKKWWETGRWWDANRSHLLGFHPELLKNGDNILVHTKGWSWISISIRKLTESHFNHVGKYYEEDGKGYVIEALFKGVVKRPLEVYFNEKKYELKAVRLKKDVFDSNKEYADGIEIARIRMHKKIGKLYDGWAIMFLVFKFTFKSWTKRFNPMQSRDSFFCSEAVCEADFGISSLNPYIYRGKSKNRCGLTTPKDCGKNNVDFITGKNIL